MSSFLAPRSLSSSISTLTEPESSEIEAYLRGLVRPSQPEEGQNALYAGFNLLLLVPKVSHALCGVNTPLPREASGTPHSGQPHRFPVLGAPAHSPAPSCHGHAKPSPCLSYDAYLVTNHGAGGEITYRPLTREERRYCGQSNGVDGRGAEEWIKVKKGLEKLKEVVKLDEAGEAAPEVAEDKIIEELFKLLAWVS